MSQEAPVSVDGVNCAEVGASQEDGLPERTVVGESLTDDHEPGEEDNSSNSVDDESVCSDLSSSSSSSGKSQDGDDDDVEEVPAPAKKTKPNAGGSAAARSSAVSAASAPAEAQGAVSPRPQAKGAARPADGGARRIVEEASPEPTKRKPSSVWEDFDVCANDSDYAVCKHCKVKIKRCGGTSSLTKHRNGQHSAVLVARNQPEPRQSTLDGSVTIGPRFLTNAVKWILLKYEVSSTAAVSNVLPSLFNVLIILSLLFVQNPKHLLPVL